VVAANGTVTALSSNPVNVSGDSAPAGGGTLVLAEPYGGWTATLNGHDLKPLAAPADGWAQGFVLPAGGGQLSISRSNLPRDLALSLELVAALLIAVFALPGKRADPAEEAAALAALREARLSRQAAGLDPGLRRIGAGRPGFGIPALGIPAAAKDKLPLGRRQRAGRAAAQDPDEPAAAAKAAGGEYAGSVAGQDYAGSTSGRDYRGSRAGREYGSAGDGLDSAGRESTSSADGAEHNGSISGRDDAGPWDMAGDWTRPGRSADGEWIAADPWTEGTGPRRAVGSGGGTRDVPVSEAPDHGGSAEEWIAPWERTAKQGATEQPAHWDSGPQRPVSAVGAQPAIPAPAEPLRSGAWDTQPGEGAWDTQPGEWDRQPGGWNVPAESRNTEGTGPRSWDSPGQASAGQADAQRAAPAVDGQPRRSWDTGPQAPASATGAQSGYDWQTSSQVPVLGDDADAGPADQQGTRQERPAHRGGKHGKPGRWPRSGRDGGS
jgi:hypothetical protein